jgi:hypothetical protein
MNPNELLPESTNATPFDLGNGFFTAHPFSLELNQPTSQTLAPLTEQIAIPPTPSALDIPASNDSAIASQVPLDFNPLIAQLFNPIPTTWANIAYPELAPVTATIVPESHTLSPLTAADLTRIQTTAVSYWENLLPDDRQLDIDWEITDLPTGKIAAATPTKFTSTGLPTGGTI